MENNYIQYEKELDVKRVAVACLRKWRMILIAMLIAALLMGITDVISQLTQESVRAEDGTMVKIVFSVSSVVMKIILGGILGAVAVCGCVFCKQLFMLLFGKNLYSMKHVCEQLNIPIMVSFHIPVGSKNIKKATKIDRLIDQLDGGAREIDVSKEYALAAAKISLVAGEKKQILVIGTVSEAELNEVAVNLNRSGIASGISFVPVAKVLQDPQCMIKVKNQAIVLVQSEEGSIKGDVFSLLELLAQSRTIVIGAILL
ncbi:MAG: hypothetical protein HFE64_02330 [Lachnospiraceae bacterium]|jgi:hypothetical protein|nr:hypothetical protein [Lachnospiraceae bacterium]